MLVLTLYFVDVAYNKVYQMLQKYMYYIIDISWRHSNYTIDKLCSHRMKFRQFFEHELKEK